MGGLRDSASPATPLGMIKIKGTTIQDAVEAVKRREGERRYAEIIGSLDEASRSVFERPVVSTQFYSLDAFLAFIDAGLRLAGEDEKVLIKRAEALVEKHLTGVYRIFIKLGSPEFVVQRIATIHKTYFQGTSVSVYHLTHGAAQIRYTGFRKQHHLIQYSLIGFYRKALELCGARNIAAEMSVPVEREEAYCELSVTWK